MNPYDFLHPYVLSGLAFIGTYCLILSYQKKHEKNKILTRGIKTLGTIIEIRPDPSGKEGEAPVVEYTTQNGSYRHFSTTYVWPTAYKVGQQVDIWYYHYKSIRSATLADDTSGTLPKVLLRWAIVLCIFTYPEIIRRMVMLV
jgi:hypothetical protein